jgi:hypothetical protein
VSEWEENLTQSQPQSLPQSLSEVSMFPLISHKRDAVSVATCRSGSKLVIFLANKYKILKHLLLRCLDALYSNVFLIKQSKSESGAENEQKLVRIHNPAY